jgi:outer membrane protein assembly factor BamB
LVSKRISYNSNLAYSLFFYGGSQMDFYIEGSGDAFYGNTVYSTNTWYYVTLVYDGTAGGSQRASVYVNGDHDITTSESSSSISNHASPLYFGMLDRTKGNGLHGTLDEVRVENTARSADWILLCYKTQHMGTRAVNHLCPVVSGPGDTVEVSARQEDADTVRIRFEAEDPQSATVTVTAQYKTVAGGSWTALTNTAGDIGAGIDTSATTDREIRWSAGDQLGNVEGSYLVRVIGFDGAWYDTTESSAFDLDCRDPSGLGSFTCTDTVSSSVTLSWDAASDANFDHYEIWYGTDQGKVQNRDGSGADGALEWDDGDQANLADAATTAATITGLSTATSYYFKIWAADDFGNESTVPDINSTTWNRVAPVWSRSSLGAVTGGSIAEEVLYLGSGAEKVYSIAVSDGGTRWTYSSINGVPGMPTYNYSGGEYRVFFSAGTHVIGLRDDGGGYSALFTPIDLGDTCGTPYAGPDDSTFHVCYGGNLTKRKVSDGSVVSGWPTAVTNLSEAADMAVFNDEVYVGTTDGKICKVDADGTPLGYSGGFAGSPRVDLPLLVRGGTVYVAPAAGKLYALNSSDLSEKWNVDLLSSNTGASFTAGNGVLYVACGHYVQRVTDEGGTASADWAFDAGGTVASGPVASTDSIVYFGRNGGQYYAVDDGGTAADTVSNWPYSAAVGDADSGPWLDQTNNRVVFATANGYLHAFSMEEE